MNHLPFCKRPEVTGSRSLCPELEGSNSCQRVVKQGRVSEAIFLFFYTGHPYFQSSRVCIERKDLLLYIFLR